MKTIGYFLTIFILNVFGATFADEDTKLLFVQILFRHGDRAPMFMYPGDPNPASAWPDGLDNLTKLGRKQHNTLGKYFRSLYEKFATYDPKEVHINSTYFNRTIRSAECNMAGFFTPTEKMQLDSDLSWQSIPVYFKQREEDYILNTEMYCPRVKAEIEKMAIGEKLYPEHKEMYDTLFENGVMKTHNEIVTMELQDTLLVEKTHGMNVPDWVDPLWNELCTLVDKIFYYLYDNLTIKRLRGGPLIKEIILNMKKKLNGGLQGRKIQVYSAHDINVAAVLSALNLYTLTTRRPPYCASVLFELHEMSDGSHAVRLLYQNATHVMQGPHAHVMTLEGCTEYCPLPFFLHFTRDIVPGDVKAECNMTAV